MSLYEINAPLSTVHCVLSSNTFNACRQIYIIIASLLGIRIICPWHATINATDTLGIYSTFHIYNDINHGAMEFPSNTVSF